MREEKKTVLQLKSYRDLERVRLARAVLKLDRIALQVVVVPPFVLVERDIVREVAEVILLELRKPRGQYVQLARLERRLALNIWRMTQPMALNTTSRDCGTSGVSSSP